MTARARTPIVHSPGVLAIPLADGSRALIDEADAHLVGNVRWHTLVCGRRYAMREVGNRQIEPRRSILMHRVILDAPPGMDVDHINLDGLDNRRCNLRLATRSQNMANTGLRSTNKSGFKGVSRRKNRWVAQAVNAEGRNTCLGFFLLAEDAARAYDAFVIATRGEFARPNFPHGISKSS